MPEIPEIRAHGERLEVDFGGTALKAFRPLSFTALKTVQPNPDEAIGRSLDGVAQRGKHLLMRFGDLTFVVHLMQGGRLRPDEKQTKKPRGGLARWVFEDGRALLLTEAGTEHRAGVWVLSGDPHQQEPLAKLGPEGTEIDADELLAAFGTKSARLHGFIRDQRQLSGIGRRLANEVLWRAKLSPFAQTSKLDADDATAIVKAIRDAVGEDLAYERTRDNMSASADRPGAVHHRVGEPCTDCNDEIRTVEYRSYHVAYCPTCQTGGRVLADNTTSRFLK